MHLESPLYRNTIHSSSQYSKVVMHSLVLPHTLLTLHICTCAGRRCERDVRCAHSVFGLQTSMPMHAALRSTKYRASSTQAAAPARWCSLCVCTSYSATSETTIYSCNWNIKMNTMDISLPTTSNRTCNLEGDIACAFPRCMTLQVRHNPAASQITS
jgi:hypothetical protein